MGKEASNKRTNSDTKDMKLKERKTFTLDELTPMVKKEHPTYTDEEIYCTVEILVHEGYLTRLSKDIFQTTDKTPVFDK